MSIFSRILVFMAGALMLCQAYAAVPTPEILMPFPEEYSGDYANLGFSVGRAIDGKGSTVPAAYFNLRSITPQETRLWVTDGTPQGSHLAASNVIDGNQAISPAAGLFFTAVDSHGDLQIFRTDGLESSSRALTQEPVQRQWLRGAIGEDVLLSRPGPPGQTAAWRVDGDTGASNLLGLLPALGVEWATISEIAIGVSYSGVLGYGVVGFPGVGLPPVDFPVPSPNTNWDYPHQIGTGTRIACMKGFTHYDPSDIRQELYCTDGTASGTRRPAPAQLATGVPLLDGTLFHPLSDRLLVQGVSFLPPFKGSPTITDGTDAGTFPLLDGVINDWSPCSNDRSGKVYLVANGNTDGQRLWVTDGSRDGSQLVVSLPSPSISCAKKGTTLAGNGMAYLQLGSSLIGSDGTPAGTQSVAGSPMLKDFAQNAWSERPQGIVALGRWLVFIAPVSATQDGLWRLDLDPIYADGMDD